MEAKKKLFNLKLTLACNSEAMKEGVDEYYIQALEKTNFTDQTEVEKFKVLCPVHNELETITDYASAPATDEQKN